MVVCSTAVAVPSSCNLGRSISLEPSKLSSSRWLQLTPLRRLPTRSRKLSAVPQRGIIPQVEAKKQTFSSFDELLEKSDKPVLVDFYATWCGPCKFMVPILEQVGEQLKDKIQVVKIDTEQYTSIANQYKIEALPTFIIFRDGKPCDRFEGAMPAHALIHRIESVLAVPQ
ncbi:thioredoxin Y, chloroplastic-like [Phoenix dactylifera]|uniref:Thioredoxin Y, chloroplastic-like n=1 Tax=Phoenix dactylifera TaxID=42345 RepID=A0A8B7BRZ2_PHODC|nr:thioredoxin Y, chloroplastic-like [Phoenix dactylifera]